MKTKDALILVAAVLALCVPCISHADSAVGHVAVVVGKPVILSAGQPEGRMAAINDPVMIGDRIVTGTGSRIKVFFNNETVLNLGENTEVLIEKHVFEAAGGPAHSLYRLIKGKMRMLVNSVFGTKAVVESPTAVAGVIGTYFIMAYDTSQDSSTVLTLEGRLEASGASGKKIPVGQKMITMIGRDKDPTEPRKATDKEILDLLSATDVPAKPGTDMNNLSRKNLADDPIALSKSMDREQGSKIGESMTKQLREGGPDIEPMAPGLAPPDGMDQDLEEPIEPGAENADVDVIIEFPDADSDSTDEQDDENDGDK